MLDNPGHVCRRITRIELDAKLLTATDATALADDGPTHALHDVLALDFDEAQTIVNELPVSCSAIAAHALNTGRVLLNECC